MTQEQTSLLHRGHQPPCMQLPRIAVVEMSVVHKLSPHLGACSKECYFLVLRTMMECMTLAMGYPKYTTLAVEQRAR